MRLDVTGRDATALTYGITADVFTLHPDNAAPVIDAPEDMTLEAAGPDGAVATYTGSATDDPDGVVAVTFTPPSGSLFPLGRTPVTATAQDFAGNATTVTFDVTVVDTTPPVITLPGDLVLEATGPGGALATFAVRAHDAVSLDVGVSLSHDSGTTFPLGTTTVTAVATDDFENAATGTFTVTVVDTTAPALTAIPSRTTLWPPNHKMVPITVATKVSDATDPSPVTRIVSVASNEAVNGPGDGNTSPDWMVTGALTLDLRAERSGQGSGRVYTITVESRDRFGT